MTIGVSMPYLPSETTEEVLRTYAPSTSFLFGQPQATILTTGIFTRIETPAKEPDALRAAIAAAFERARVFGVKNPIVVGSIPFDTARPSALLIPADYRVVRQVEEPVSPAADCRACATPTRASTPHATRRGASAAPDRDKESFRKAVDDILQILRQGEAQKVVLSRALDVTFDAPRRIADAVGHLLRSARSGYRFSVPLGPGETLIGASPELLVSKRGPLVVSNPLAGSLPRARFPDERLAAAALTTSDKDLREHRFVVDEVARVLARYCRELDVPPGPSLLATRHLWHLSTTLEGTLSEPAADALSLACALHPTPAVCGFPSGAARDVIDRVEGFDRGLFAGMTGWMDGNGDGEWAVTIRCGVMCEGSARIFAGAGVVAGSCPDLEWEETATKMEPMLQALDAARAEVIA